MAKTADAACVPRRTPPRRILVLGAYGLIGADVVRRLLADGCHVTGLGRNSKTAQSILPQIDWIIQDMAGLCDESAWQDLLEHVDIVVNCAGALQESYQDNLDVVHHRAIKALAAACQAMKIGLIQISAVGALEDATTAFMRTKARGDAAIRHSGAEYWIFRPGLVLSPTAYGGTALLRMLAAFPVVQPIAQPDAQLQTVSVFDVANAVSMAARGKIPPNTEYDLVEDHPQQLRQVVALQRQWLGFSPARLELAMPGWLLFLTRHGADLLGRLGWRSPLRSSAIQALKDGVVGDPLPWKAISGAGLSSMAETLAIMPVGVEDRQFARMALLMPFVVAVLFVFWLISGIVGFYKIDTAAKILENTGWSHGFAVASVGFWSLVDLVIAGALMVRKYAARACWAMVIVSVVYLISATFTVPQLWSDPLGPLIKVLPGVVLALIARVMLESR